VPADTAVIYGVNPAFEAIIAERRKIHEAYLNRSSANSPRLRKLVGLLQSRGIPHRLVEKGKLIQLADTHDHQGVVLLADPYPYVPFAELIGKRRLVLLDNIEDPHNVGAIIRSAEVLGFDAVLLPRRGVPGALPSVLKASAGACEHIPIAINCATNQYVKIAMDEGYHIAALDGKGETTIEELQRRLPSKLLLVVGGENKGVRQYILNEADDVVSIPRRGRVTSLNASVAAGIALAAFSGTE
jgi:23S rRNA (guanosine2251-2'-O)-methyltransferase